MAGNDKLDLEYSGVLGDASQGTLDQADVMGNDLFNLIADMENIPAALRGSAGDQFSAAGTALANCFDDLLRWCSENGMNLGEGSSMVSTADTEGSEIFAQDLGTLSNLSRIPNA